MMAVISKPTFPLILAFVADIIPGDSQIPTWEEASVNTTC